MKRMIFLVLGVIGVLTGCAMTPGYDPAAVINAAKDDLATGCLEIDLTVPGIMTQTTRWVRSNSGTQSSASDSTNGCAISHGGNGIKTLDPIAPIAPVPAVKPQ